MVFTKTHSGLVQIARFRSADNEAVAELILHVQRVEYGLPLERGTQPDLAHIAGAFRDNGSRFWVARAMDAVIGSVGLHDMGCGNGEVRRMFVAALAPPSACSHPRSGRSGPLGLRRLA